MKVLFISRKKSDGYGGLSRFYAQLSTNFPYTHYNLSPESFLDILKLPINKPTHIYLCDATLLPLGFVFKTIFNKPLIVTAHGLDLTYKNPLYQTMLRWLLPKTDVIVLDSKRAKHLLDGFNLSQPIEVINPGVSIEHLKEKEPILLPNLTDKITLTTVGNLVKRKGHIWFIENVMTNLSKDFVYLIVGEGSEEKNIRKIVDKLKLKKRVFLLGRLTHFQLAYVLNKTNIYVCPNQKLEGNFESFGIATAEAAALGLPVVASKVDGIPQAIKHNKNGLLIEPTPAEFIKALINLKGVKIRKELGNRAKVYTNRNYTWSKTTNRYFNLFSSLSKN